MEGDVPHSLMVKQKTSFPVIDTLAQLGERCPEIEGVKVGGSSPSSITVLLVHVYLPSWNDM